MDLPKQKNIIIQNNATDSEYIDALKSDNIIKPLENIANFKMENLNKLEKLVIKHHICDNTTGESKNLFYSCHEYKDENLNFESIVENDIDENNGIENNIDQKAKVILRGKTNNLFSFSSLKNKITFPLLGRKIFRIKKYTKYNKYLNEICTDSEITDEEKNKLKDPKGKKISPFSKVNFSKLKVEEKDERLKNLAKLVKRLRRKVRNLENKVRFNASKLLNKYVWTKLGINTKNKYVPPEFSFDFDKICRALKRVRNHEDFEFADQKHIIENLINLIAEDKLKLDSLGYRRICSQIRMLLKKDQIKHNSKKNSKVTITFPETEVYITKSEYNKLKIFKDKEEILRAILGVYDEEEKTVKISIDNQKEDNKQVILEDKAQKTIEEPITEDSLKSHINENKKEIKNEVITNSVNKKSIIFNNDNINQSSKQKINQIMNNQKNNSESSKHVFSNNIFNKETACNNVDNINQISLKNYQNNNIIDNNNFSTYQNNIFGIPLSELNNIQSQEQHNQTQENFPYNLIQNPNLLLGLNSLNGINNNLSNYLNPMQMFLLNNARGTFNQNPQYFNNFLIKQNIPQTIPNQNESNLFCNFNNSNNDTNNNVLKSPRNNNFFFDNQNSLYNNPKNNNLFANKDKNQNSSYNVFLK